MDVVEGHILVNGALPSRDPAAQAQREADQVRSALKRFGFGGTVVPMVCFASDTFGLGTASVGGVKVMNARVMVDWFAAQPDAMPKSDLDRLVQLMESGGRV